MVLTDKYVGHEGRRQTEHDHKNVRDGQVDDEEVGDRPHARRAVHHGDDEAVPDQADQEHQQVGGAVHGGHGAAVPVHELVGQQLQLGAVERRVQPQRVLPLQRALHVRGQRLQVRQHAVVRHELTVHRLHYRVRQQVHHVMPVALPHVGVVVVPPVVARLVVRVRRKVIVSILTHFTRRNPQRCHLHLNRTFPQNTNTKLSTTTRK